jgi:hypothetical protein
MDQQFDGIFGAPEVYGSLRNRKEPLRWAVWGDALVKPPFKAGSDLFEILI